MYIKRLASYFVIFSYIWTLLGAPISAYALSGREIVVTQTQTLTSSTKALPFATKTHLVRKAETISTIRKHYNLSLIGFKKLNPSYKGSLKAGSLIVVPRTPLSDAMSHYLDGHNNYSSSLASAMSVQDAKSLKGSLFNSAASMASSELSGVFGRYGTLELNLAAAESSNKNKFSFANSQFTALLPLYDKGRYSIFTQIGHHQMDDKRSIGNFGIGERYFANDYMVGGNAFYDYDYTEHLSRLGIGAEYGRDFLKAAANLYLGQISSWKNPNIHSLDETNYASVKERAANGWDIRANAYLPSMPNIGGKLMLEQYYGDKVALLGKDILQKDPYALTVGVDYTPVPLFNFNVDYKRGKNSQHQTRFGVNLTYHLGESLAAQLNPNNVARLRSLNGGRYELVDRNNDIVLNYKIEAAGPSIIYTQKMSVDEPVITADGKDQAHITYMPTTSDGRPVTGLVNIKFTATGNDANQLKLSSVKEIHPGRYTATATSTITSNYTISAHIINKTLAHTFLAADKYKPNSKTSKIIPTSALILTNSIKNFTFKAMDGSNNTIKNIPINKNTGLAVSASSKFVKITNFKALTQKGHLGEYSFDITSSKAGIFWIYVTYKNTPCSVKTFFNVMDKNQWKVALSSKLEPSFLR